ncbi:HetP family heterocyst commitment protein [Nostoc sp. UHCC 0302]|uniref:HetP family heterocyst commitment protein n=1 Tax=Nostoc sp. UHCC 0302 TaxID=3134896 RepID=UPI00311CB56F
MNYQVSSQNSFHQAITPEQLNQIIEAIVEGRYSWACVLILRFVGYNPLHFIPQRTYSRLIKENSQATTANGFQKNQIQPTINSSIDSSSQRDSSRVLTKIHDRDYLEISDKKSAIHEVCKVPSHCENKITELSSYRLHKLNN